MRRSGFFILELASMLRFSIRDVLWLTVTAALLCGWWLDRSSLVWSYGEAKKTIANLREKLDLADPRGAFQAREAPTLLGDRMVRSEFGYVLGLALFSWRDR
jgi:hypothetical protein